MKVFHLRKLAIVFSMLLLFMSNIHAALELVIPPYRQWGSNTCWAACSYMILKAYQFSGIGSDEMIIRKWAYPTTGPDRTNQLFGTDISVDAILDHFGSIETNPTPFNPNTGGGNISQTDLTTEIDGNKPALAGRLISDGTSTGRKHMLLIRGYTGSGGSNAGSVIYNDPASGQRVIQTYAEFVRKGNDYQWIESLRLITKPHYPIPVGMYDWCRIYDNGTTIITPSTTTLSYTAGFHSVEMPPEYPVSWTWNLVFVHSGGDCIAQTWTSNSTATTSNWNISGFSLPTGYQWVYNKNGEIPGRVDLYVLDNGGYSHIDGINVTYIPSNLYPGIITYENQTVSSSQPEVKAHQMIITQNDQFISGGNITFRSGERIDIKDGITIQNGSTTNFITDPSVR